MAGTSSQNTPSKSARASAKKRSRVSNGVSPHRAINPVDTRSATVSTPTPQRRRASDFASKKSSAKKRRRNRAENATPSSTRKTPKKRDTPNEQEEEEESVDEVLRQVRELMKSNATDSKSKALAKALKRADDTFENDVSGSSSDEENSDSEPTVQEQIEQPEKPSDQKKMKTLEESHERSQPLDDASSEEQIKPSKHQAEIEALKKDDPLFYKFLEENDGSLLDFSMSDGSDEEDMQKEDAFRKQLNRKSAQKHKNEKKAELNRAHDTSNSEHDAILPSRDDKELTENGGSSMEVDAKSSEEEEESSSDADAVEGDKDKNQVPNPKIRTASSSEDSEAENDGEVDDVEGYSDESGSDAGSDEEAKAAAEAGLDVQGESGASGDSGLSDDERKPPKAKKKTILVDMRYLRNLKELLKSKRSALKACKDLLRLFRAGRGLLPSSPKTKDKKAKENEKGKKAKGAAKMNEKDTLAVEDMEDDLYTDDGGFTSGKVKFASARSYQQAMNLAIIGIQDALDRILGKPPLKKGKILPLVVKWDPKESSRWGNMESIFRPYVFHMLALCEATEDAGTLRFLLQRLEALVPYTRDNMVLLKKITRVALHVWSSDRSHLSDTTRLRAYVLLTRLAHGTGNAEIVLRASCNAYSTKVANVCNPKTLPLIDFTASCLVELFGIDMGASYTTCFSYLREMAISLRAVLVSKDPKQEVERIHNWSYVNKLRLMSKVLGRYGGEDELHALIYPYVQISIGVMRLQPTPRTYPLRLHLASYLSDLMAETGVYIPVVPHLLRLLRCSELHKKAEHGSKAVLEWRSILRVSDEVIKTKPFLTGVIHGVVYQVAKFFSVIAKHVSFPELANFAEINLKRLAKELTMSQWKMSLTGLAEKLHQTSEIVARARSQADFSPSGAINSAGMLALVPGIDRERKMPIQRFFDVEHGRVMKEEKLRNEEQSMKEATKETDATERDDGDVDMSEESEGSEEGVEVRRNSEKGKMQRVARKVGIGLAVPHSQDSDEEEDQLAELSLGSDSESGSE